MEYGKFIISGEDKKTLARVKNTLTSNGHIFIGYAREPLNILRHIRNTGPDFIILEICNNFGAMKQVLGLIDEDLLAACLLVLDTRNDEIFEFLRSSRAMTYITKPVFDEAVLQVTDLSLINYRRILDYEQKVRKLNETLENRKIIEKAKWILVEREGYSESQAYELIKRKSRDNRIPMREIAEALILTRG